MFTTNTITVEKQPLSSSKQNTFNIIRAWSHSQKRKTINLLRQASTCQPLLWNLRYQQFAQTSQNCNNIFSLLCTLFEISSDPLWRNRVSHICILIKKIHNICIETYGGYLNELSRIENYHSKMLNIFYFNDSQVQQHFKNLIKVYLNHNRKYSILDEESFAVGLLDAGRSQKANKLPEYLWIVSQMKGGEKAIGKVLKLAQECINSNQANKALVILPCLTILSNYIYNEKRINVLEELIKNGMFQNILILSLQTTESVEISRQALLLTNNILAKSHVLSQLLISSQAFIVTASSLSCEEQLIFQKLLQIRRSEKI